MAFDRRRQPSFGRFLIAAAFASSIRTHSEI
jgi:hypothetical protein